MLGRNSQTSPVMMNVRVRSSGAADGGKRRLIRLIEEDRGREEERRKKKSLTRDEADSADRRGETC
jgi:hypothetical protein